MYLPTEKQWNEIKDFIQDELLKRGIHAKIIKCGLKEIRGNQYPDLETEEFQTTPVIFKSLKVGSFNSSMTEEKEEDTPYTYIWMRINYLYTHFGGGSNGCDLFDFSCKVIKDGIWTKRIR